MLTKNDLETNLERVHDWIKSADQKVSIFLAFQGVVLTLLFSSIFSWWDKIFSSFQFRENTHEIQFGLPDRVEEKDQSVRGMIIDPLRNN